MEVEGQPGNRYVIGRTLVRIGREEDNDICLAANTVHRYHAVIRRTTDGDVVITDLSGEEGNGVLVNGARVAEARLKQGDAIHRRRGQAALRCATGLAQYRLRARAGGMKRFRSMIFGRFAMADEGASTTQDKAPQGAKGGRFLGSLKDALAAASRDETGRGQKAPAAAEARPPQVAKAKEATQKPAAGEAADKEPAAPPA